MQLETQAQRTRAGLGFNLLSTLLQSAAVWAVLLLLIPSVLVRVEMAAAIPNFASVKCAELGLVLFMASSTIFLICVWNIVWLGGGTPWPWDRNTRFVVAGPYRYVRNPMVMAGIGQGLASALILGSYLGLIYLAVGVVIWNFILRPMEEGDMATLFGKPYVEYFQSVGAYLPRLKPYASSMVVLSVDEAV